MKILNVRQNEFENLYVARQLIRSLNGIAREYGPVTS